ncbi:MAG: hypothetical protein LBJ17_04710 [Dysgonamonadaceae bacterium]|nr:hypothetical protein [Dysgonamonadaceae bacterium]
MKKYLLSALLCLASITAGNSSCTIHFCCGQSETTVSPAYFNGDFYEWCEYICSLNNCRDCNGYSYNCTSD